MRYKFIFNSSTSPIALAPALLATLDTHPRDATPTILGEKKAQNVRKCVADQEEKGKEKIEKGGGETTPGDWIKDKVMYEFNALT